jgi:hypothetical protein
MMSSANTGHPRQSGERGSYSTQGEQDFIHAEFLQYCTQLLML